MPGSAFGVWVFAPALALGTARTPEGGDAAGLPRISIGESTTGVLGAGGTSRDAHGRPVCEYSLASDSDATATVALDSFDFDAHLRILDPEGRVVAEDDDGGVETNARSVVALRAKVAYRLQAGVSPKSLGGRSVAVDGDPGAAVGEYALEIAGGSGDPPDDWATQEAIDYRREAARRADARGDRITAARHRELAASLAAEREQFRRRDRLVELEATLAEARERDDSEATFGALLDILGILEALADLVGAARRATEILAMVRAAGRRDLELACLGRLSNAYLQLGDYPRCREVTEELLAFARSLGDRTTEAKATLTLGNVSYLLGEAATARRRFEELVDLTREIGDRSLEAAALGALGNVADSVGDPKTAKAFHRRHLEIAEAIGDPQGTRVAITNYANACIVLGEFDEARRYHERVLALSREAGDVRLEASDFGRLGIVHFRLGDLETAREYHERHLEVARRLEDRAGHMMALANLGLVLADLGEFAAAERAEEEALALGLELGAPDKQLASLNNLGSLAWRTGDFARAIEVHERQLALAERVGDRLERGRAHANLGLGLWALGRSDRARVELEDALRIAREMENPRETGIALGNLGGFLADVGDLDAARRLAEEHARIARESGEKAGEADARTNLASVAFRAGDAAGAIREASGALALYDAIGAESRALDALATLALARIDVGELDGAATALVRAGKELDRAAATGLGIESASRLRSRNAVWSRIAQSLAARRFAAALDDAGRRAAVADGFVGLGAWKGRSLLEGILERRRGARTPEVVALRRRAVSLHEMRSRTLESVAAAVRGGAPSNEIDLLRERARDLLAEAGRIEGELRTLGRGEAPFAAAVAPEEAARSILGGVAVLLDFAAAEDRLLVYVVEPSGRTTLVDLGERAALERRAAAWVAALSDPRLPGSARALLDEGSALGETLVRSPLVRALGDASEARIDRLVVVPNDSLATLPFEALVYGGDADAPPARAFAEARFVLDRFSVAYGPSTPVLAALEAGGPLDASRRALILADPTYEGESAAAVATADESSAPAAGSSIVATRALPDRRVIRRIPNTRREACDLAERLSRPADADSASALLRLEESRSGSVRARRFDLHLGAEATAARLRDDLRGFGVIHLAAHGYVDADRPERSGLALASNHEDSGFLTIPDVLDLDLDADLVVLSACDTARGEIRAGEGVHSVAGAFLFAGATSVVATLWQVDDPSAAEVFRRFYENALDRGADPANALREAKLSLRRKRSTDASLEPLVRERRGVGSIAGEPTGRGVDLADPFFWAPFIFVGRVPASPPTPRASAASRP